MAKPSTLSATEARRLLIGALRIADVTAVCSAGFAAYWVRHGFVETPKLYLIAIMLGAVLSSGYLHSARVYTFETVRQTALQLGAVAGCWVSVFGTLLLFAYSIKISDELSRVWAVSWFAFGLAGFAVARLVLLLQVARWVRRGVLTLNVAVVGAGELGSRLIQFIESQKDSGVRLVGVYDNRQTRIPKRVGRQVVLGTVDDLVHRLKDHKVDEIIVALPWRAESHLVQILDKLKSVAAEVRLCPEAVAFELPNLGYDAVLGIPMLKILERPLTGWSTIAKGIEDRALAGLLFAILSPVFVLIAVAVAVDSPGPVLFRQTRYGFNNNEFKVLKFRTMHALAATDGEVTQARANDPRVTRVGRVLRRTSLDELPQLLNVLAGEMSLVGPRPHAVPHNVKYAGLFDGYLRRHRMKPGITGWAQVRGFRGEIQSAEDMRLRVQHDLYYIEHWSLLFDLKILFLTLLTGFAHRKEYWGWADCAIRLRVSSPPSPGAARPPFAGLKGIEDDVALPARAIDQDLQSVADTGVGRLARGGQPLGRGAGRYAAGQCFGGGRPHLVHGDVIRRDLPALDDPGHHHAAEPRLVETRLVFPVADAGRERSKRDGRTGGRLFRLCRGGHRKQSDKTGGDGTQALRVRHHASQKRFGGWAAGHRNVRHQSERRKALLADFSRHD